MGSSKGSSGNPALFTGGGVSGPPPVASSVRMSEPSYPTVLPASGSVMATPESVANAIAAGGAYKPAAPIAAPAAGGLGDLSNLDNLRAQLAKVINPSMMLSGEDRMLMGMGGAAPSWYTPQMHQQARNDSLANIFAGSMGNSSGPYGARSGR